jgi:DNA-binding NtrC family response regulator
LFEKRNIVSQPRNHHRIFIVDDEHVIASTLAMILRNQGFEATSFTEPLDALETALCEAPDLLISDVMMPRLSGIELAIEVRKHCPECKVLLFSGQASTANLLEAARANGHAFEILAKPVHPTNLLRQIQNVLGANPPAPHVDEFRADV